MSSEMQTLLEAARSEAQRMTAAINGVKADATVRMTASQFAELARMLQQLCELIPDHAVDQEDEVESFSASRQWVPLESFTRIKRAVNALEEELRSARQQQSWSDILKLN